MSAPFFSAHACPRLWQMSLTTLLYRLSVTATPCGKRVRDRVKE